MLHSIVFDSVIIRLLDHREIFSLHEKNSLISPAAMAGFPTILRVVCFFLRTITRFFFYWFESEILNADESLIRKWLEIRLLIFFYDEDLVGIKKRWRLPSWSRHRRIGSVFYVYKSIEKLERDVQYFYGNSRILARSQTPEIRCGWGSLDLPQPSASFAHKRPYRNVLFLVFYCPYLFFSHI